MKERINLTPGYCRDIKARNKQFFVHDLNCPGLWLRIYPSGFKTWYYHYRPKGRQTTSIKLGRFEMLNPSQARTRAKEIQADIIKGNDPYERKQKWKTQLSFGEELKSWFKNTLTTPRFRKSTIKTIKGSLNVWIFHKTKDSEVRKKLNVLENIRHKKISSINKKHIKKLHEVITEKSPYMANRVVAYLKMFFNHVLGASQDNPCKIPSKGFLNEEKEYLDYLSQRELEALVDAAFVKDERAGRLLVSYYKKRSLNPVSCCAITFQLSTGRRTRTEASNIQWSWLRNGENPRLILPKTKTSSKQKDPILSFGLGALSMDILNTIKRDKLNNSKSAFYYPIDDERNKYVFPSKDYGRITGPNAKPSKTPHVNDLRATWKKLLAMVGVTRHLKHYATRHTVASSTLTERGNLKLVAKVLGTSVETASKYAKLQHDEEREVLDDIFKKREKNKIREVK
jgi:site-specific recombinase XerD|tara:strand:- start:158 stop:1522 length:1365 start_codon:yes stop_codon:yes gene_type:complete